MPGVFIHSIRTFLLAALAMFIGASAWAQRITVKGTFEENSKIKDNPGTVIGSTAQEAGWQIRKEQPGLFFLFMMNAKGEASTIKIEYDKDGYVIKPVSSSSRDDVYNRQVDALDKQVRASLGMSPSTASRPAASSSGFWGKINQGLAQTVAALNDAASDITSGSTTSRRYQVSSGASRPASAETASGGLQEVVLPKPEWEEESMAVLPVNVMPEDPVLAQALSGEVESALKETDYFTIVDMSRLNTFLEMKELQATDLFANDDAMAAFGEFIGARIVVGTEVAKLSSRAFALSIKMVDAGTSEVLCHPPQRTHEGEAIKLLPVARLLSREVARDYAIMKIESSPAE